MWRKLDRGIALFEGAFLVLFLGVMIAMSFSQVIMRNFFETGDTSDFTKEAFQFLQNFERDRQATQIMIEKFKELDLFEPKEMHFQGQNADGTPAERQKIADYFAVTEEKLRALEPKTLKELTENGYMAVAHAHMISLGNWQRLVNMTLRKAAAN